MGRVPEARPVCPAASLGCPLRVGPPDSAACLRVSFAQIAQDLGVDCIVAERGVILAKSEFLEPSPNVPTR
jgi:hypothetical protein